MTQRDELNKLKFRGNVAKLRPENWTGRRNDFSEKQFSPTKFDMVDTQKLAQSFTPGSQGALQQMFRAAGARAPTVIWSPSLADLDHPILRRFHERAVALPKTAGGIAWDDFSMPWFEGLEDWMMVLEYVETEDTFRYRRYGAGIADAYGKDMTGRRIDDFGGHISQFFSVIYQAVKIRKEWVFTEHEPPRKVLVNSWMRLIVPLMDGAEVRGFVVVNAPENAFRAGLEVISDPVFLLDEDLNVLFANRTAQRVFPQSASTGQERSLFAMTGITLRPKQGPIEMASTRSILDDVHISIDKAIAEQFQVALSATFFHNRAFYVLQVRALPAF